MAGRVSACGCWANSPGFWSGYIRYSNHETCTNRIPSICPICHGHSWTDYLPGNSHGRHPTILLYCRCDVLLLKEVPNCQILTFVINKRLHTHLQWVFYEKSYSHHGVCVSEKWGSSRNMMKERRTAPGCRVGHIESAVVVLKPVPLIKTTPAQWDASDSPRKWSVSTLLQSISPWYPSHMAPYRTLIYSGQFTDWSAVCRGGEKQREVARTAWRTAWRATGRTACNGKAIRSLISWHMLICTAKSTN